MTQAEVLETLAQNGFVFVRQKKRKIYKHPSGRLWAIPATPSNEEVWLNNLSNLKRYILLGRARGIFDAPTSSAPITPASVPSTIAPLAPPVTKPFKERLRGIPIEKFNRMRRSQPQARPLARPQVKIQVQQPQSAGEKPEKHKFIGMQEVGMALHMMTSGMFSSARITADDLNSEKLLDPADLVSLNEFNPDERARFQKAVDDLNARVDRAAVSAAARLQNVVRDLRRGRRVGKRHVCNKLYSGLVRILERDELAATLTGCCMRQWKFISALKTTYKVEVAGGEVTFHVRRPGKTKEAAQDDSAPR